MKRFALRLQRRVLKQLTSIPQPFRQRIEQSIDGLLTNPYPHGCSKLQGHAAKWRIRVGDYRVVYCVEETVQIIEIHAVGHRQSIYKN